MSEQRLPRLSLRELGAQTGESSECLEQWRSLGLIGAAGPNAFELADVERVRLIGLCVRRGIAIETIVRAEATEEGFLQHYLDQLFPSGIERSYSLGEAAEMARIDVKLLRRIAEIIGLTNTAERIGREDVEILRGWKIALDGGLPEEALLQLVSVYADCLGRVAEAEVRLFHFHVHARLKDGGSSGLALRAATETASKPMRQLIEPALLYFHRKGMAHALREDMLMHLAEYSGEADASEAAAQLRLAIVFLDLASFTPLTESMGDTAAAEIVARFSELVREAVNRHHGRVVERIGDAFMLTFTDSRDAVACALEIRARTKGEAPFPALHGGIHFGPVLYREGAYVGSNVNVAARVASEAQRHQILVTAEVRREAAPLLNVEFVSVGKRRLKGLTDELELFEARGGGSQADTVVDPVCGMELTPAEIAAKATVGGTEVSFCSEKCLRIFVDSRTK
jgi:adenylate cyclase